MATRFLVIDGKIAKDTRTGMPVALTDNIFTNVTYEVLKTMRDNGHLLAGEQYRITDYVATTTQDNTQSAGHPFDIIVVADSPNTLNENARAVAHDGDTYFANCKLSAWEIKYSLDNDKTRFWWALDGQTIVNLVSGFSNGTPLTRQPIFDGSCPDPEYSEYQYAWGTQADVEDDDAWNFVYSKSETLTNGEIVFSTHEGGLEVAEVVSGKGVIYYMKDEYGNECPYDFKNIQFKRWATDDEIANDDKFYSSWDDTGNAFRWCYTFMANGYTNDTWADASTIKPYGFMNDYGYPSCIKNKIEPYILQYNFDEDTNDKEGVRWLNNIVLYGQYEDDPANEDGYSYNYLECPSGNTFGLNCYNSTLGKMCVSNKFADFCHSNRLGGFCHFNTFGNFCQCNVLGDNFRSNVIGDSCRDNTFMRGFIWGIVDSNVTRVTVQPTEVQYAHIHSGVVAKTITLTSQAKYTQDVRTANDVTITV